MEIKRTISGNMSDPGFDQLQEKLVEAFMASDRIELDLGTRWEADRALVELICSAHRVAHSLGKSFAFGSDTFLQGIRQLANDSGYAGLPCKYRDLGCLYHFKKPDLP